MDALKGVLTGISLHFVRLLWWVELKQVSAQCDKSMQEKTSPSGSFGGPQMFHLSTVSRYQETDQEVFHL